MQYKDGVKKDLFNVQLGSACTVEGRVHKPVCSPSHAIPSLIPTMKYAQGVARRKLRHINCSISIPVLID